MGEVVQLDDYRDQVKTGNVFAYHVESAMSRYLEEVKESLSRHTEEINRFYSEVRDDA